MRYLTATLLLMGCFAFMPKGNISSYPSKDPFRDSFNLVPDPFFEKLRGKGCSSEIMVLKYWYAPTPASTDYYKMCRGRTNTFYKKFGEVPFLEGNGFVGFYTYSKPQLHEYILQRNYREYIQTKLIEPLQKDSLYLVEAYICLAPNSDYASNIGIALTNEKVSRNIAQLIKVKPQIFTPDDSLIESTEWVPLRGLYKAHGGEQYLTIGNFIKNRKTKLKTTGKHLEGLAYYYADNVSVIKVQDTATVR